MHKLGFIAIKNFRLCRDVALPLGAYTPLVGQNNTGKSSILQAIAWVLKPSALSSSDFGDPAKPVEVCARIDGITNELVGLMPDAKHRAAIQPYCATGVMWIRVTATGTAAKGVKAEIYDVEKHTGDAVPTEWRDYPTGLPQAVSALLPEPLQIDAMDDIGEDLGKAKAGTTIKGLLDEIMGPILKAHGELNEAISSIKKVLTMDGESRSQHLKDFDVAASQSLDAFFPGLALDLDLQLVDIKEFFKAGDLHVTDKLSGDRRRFDQVGTGAQRAIQMALIRYLSELQDKGDRTAQRRLLLIDEPELYLHPQGVRRLRQALAALSGGPFQVVFSTHSPLMLSRENAADTVIVGKTKEQGTHTRLPLRIAVKGALEDAESQSRTLFELGNLAEIYFAERVVLCEGKTDRRILPLAYERLRGVPQDGGHVTFVSLGSCSDVPKALPVLRAMGIRACAVVDLDFAFTAARSGGKSLLPKDDDDMTQVKNVLARLHKEKGCHLGDNGMPSRPKDGKDPSKPADTWALLASDAEGAKIVDAVHASLHSHAIWAWKAGCIEHVTGWADKGEQAIIDQEAMLQQMSADDVRGAFPAFYELFEWVDKQWGAHNAGA